MSHRHFHAATAVWLCLLLACRSREPDGIALLGATLIDGSGGPPLAASAVVIRRGRIESVGSRADFRLPKRTTEMDLTGRWIMPGLVDAHVHLVDPQAGVARWSMDRYLAWGVTTVRDMHGPLRSVLAVRRELDRGWRPGPRVYAAGAMLDGAPSTYPDAITARTAKEARRGVEAHKLAQEVAGVASEDYVTAEYLEALQKEMLEAAQNLEFERAALLRDRLASLRGEKVASPQATGKKRGGGRKGGGPVSRRMP